MLVRDALVETLADRGIETVFGIPGTQTLPLNEALRGRDDVRHVTARHETAVPHMAWGHAEATGRPAATLVVPGPGDLNATNGLLNAAKDGVPLVHLSVETEPGLRGGDAIHETPPAAYDEVVTTNVTVETPAAAAATLDRAIVDALSAPRGPVRVGIPRPFLTESTTDPGGRRGAEPTPAPAPDAGRLDRAADLLSAADRPVVVAGGGVRSADAAVDLRRVAERLDAPVVSTHRAVGSLPADHPLAAGVLSVASSAAVDDLFEAADAALAVGTDLDAVATRGFDAPLPDRLVHATLTPADLGQGYEPTVAPVGDAGATLAGLTERLPDGDGDGDGAARARAVRETDAALMADVLSVSEPPLTSAAAVAAVDEALPRDAVVSLDAGGCRIWAVLALSPAHPRSLLDVGSWGTMGSSVPAALGAAVAAPDRPAVAIVGDGGLLMCAQTIHAAAAADLPVVVVALNNDDYGTISWAAARDHGFEPGAFGWGDSPVAAADLAESLGARGRRVETPAAVTAAVETALAADGPTLIEVPTDPDEPQAKPLS